MVTVRLNLALIKIAGSKEFEIPIENPSKLNVVLDNLGIEKSSVGIIIKNGRWAPLDCTIVEDDILDIFPHLDGG